MEVTLGIPCRADEPGLQDTLNSLLAACRHPDLPPTLTVELVVCINGVQDKEECRPLMAVREVCESQGIRIQELALPNPTTEDLSPSARRSIAGLQDDAPSRGLQAGFSRRRRVARSLYGRAEDCIIAMPAGLGAEHLSSPFSPQSVPVQSCTVLLTKQLGKPRAWNHIWRQAQGALVCFCDADVRVGPEAVATLYKKMQQEPHLSLVAAREVPVLKGKGTLWSRIGALGYRFDFGNAGGRLYLIRKEALPQGMPEDLLLEDAWLTVAVGKQQVTKELRAEVYFLPPATWRDYFAERVRTEGGKLQIRRVHGALLAQGPIAQYRWSQFWRAIPFREYPLVLCAVALRGMARMWAWLAVLRRDFYALYRPFPSTKGWTSVHR